MRIPVRIVRMPRIVFLRPFPRNGRRRCRPIAMRRADRPLCSGRNPCSRMCTASVETIRRRRPADFRILGNSCFPSSETFLIHADDRRAEIFRFEDIFSRLFAVSGRKARCGFPVRRNLRPMSAARGGEFARPLRSECGNGRFAQRFACGASANFGGRGAAVQAAAACMVRRTAWMRAGVSADRPTRRMAVLWVAADAGSGPKEGIGRRAGPKLPMAGPVCGRFRCRMTEAGTCFPVDRSRFDQASLPFGAADGVPPPPPCEAPPRR